MKKVQQKGLSLFLALCMMAAVFCCSASAGETVTLKTVADTASWIVKQEQPVTITKGRLNQSYRYAEIDTPIYLVALQDKEQSSGAKALIQASVPKNSNLVLAGYGIGGQVAQQLAADSNLKAQYEILFTCSFGAPVSVLTGTEGVVQRLGDTKDPNVRMPIAFKSSGYGDKFVSNPLKDGQDAHASYTDPDLWGSADCVGHGFQDDSNVVITLDPQTEVGSDSKVTYKNSIVNVDTMADLIKYLRTSYNKNTAGPICISQAVLHRDGENLPVYLVTLAGLESDGQGNDINACLHSGFNLESTYSRRLRQVMTQNIPENANVVIIGDSLGGMTAEQMAADPTIKDRYNILYTMTTGSPNVDPIGREGQVIRMCDVNDPVPYLSVNLPLARMDRVEDDAGFGKFSFDAHGKYYRDPTWSKYDVMGQKGGRTSMTIDTSTAHFYKVPK